MSDSQHTCSAAASGPPAEDLRIGVIGAGGRGAIARYAHLPGQGSRVVSCLDVNEAILHEARDFYGPDTVITTDLDDFLDSDIDAVLVCSPDFLHVDHATAALRAGKAVFLEKPLAIDTAGCDKVLRAAVDSGGRLYVGHNMRHMLVVTKMKELIDQGAIGDVKTAWVRHFVGNGGDFYFKDWHATRDNVNGLLVQKAAHDIDVLHWLCGGYTRRVNAMGSLMVYGQITDRLDDMPHQRADLDTNRWPPLTQTGLAPTIDVEDVSMMQMLLDNGVLAAYQQCHFTPDYWRSYTVIGTEGRIENFGDVGQGAEVRLWNRRIWDHGPADETFDVTPPPETDDHHGGADRRIMAEFVEFAARGVPATTSPVSARNSVAAADAATTSLRNGGIPIDVPPVASDVVAYFRDQPGPS